MISLGALKDPGYVRTALWNIGFELSNTLSGICGLLSLGILRFDFAGAWIKCGLAQRLWDHTDFNKFVDLLAQANDKPIGCDCPECEPQKYAGFGESVDADTKTAIAQALGIPESSIIAVEQIGDPKTPKGVLGKVPKKEEWN